MTGPLLVDDAPLTTSQARARAYAFETASAARRFEAPFVSQHVTSCLAGAVRTALAGVAHRSDATISSDVVVVPLPPLARGAGSFAYRMAATAVPTSNAGSFPIYVDLVGFVQGAYLAELVTVSLYDRFPSGLEARAAQSLVALLGS